MGIYVENKLGWGSPNNGNDHTVVEVGDMNEWWKSWKLPADGIEPEGGNYMHSISIIARPLGDRRELVVQEEE